MKKAAFILSFILISLTVISQTYYGSSARAIVPGTDMLVKDPLLDIPSFIRFAKGSEIDFKQVPSWVKSHFSISPDFDLTLLREDKDNLGFTHYRYQQTYKGYPVHSNIFIFHVKNGIVVSMNGQLFSKLDVKAVVILNETEALNKALAFVGAVNYKWQMPEEEHLLKYALNDENATYFPKGVLVMIPADDNYKGPNYRLAWKFDIYANQPMSRQWIFVDAASGKIIKTLQRIQSEHEEVLSNAVATALTKYNNTRTITTDYTGSTYRLRETGRGLGIETYNLNNGTNYGSATDFTNATTSWSAVNNDQVARDAHWGAEVTYDYFLSKHSRNSIDNAGLKLLSYVHYDNNYDNAFWDGTKMTYGDGAVSETPYTTLDICGHEITHGLTENTAGLTYSYESGALNEGFSDIFGTSIEFYASPPLQTGNWEVGEDIGSPFRSMSNPNLYSQPDTYQGNLWYSGSADNGGVHTNSGVVNFWYYLLCQGGSGTNDNGNSYNVTGITMAKAELIAFRALTVYLTSSSQYADARTATLQATYDIYGSCSQELISATNAWYAVGVGASYSATATVADFTTASSQNLCAGVPLTTQFSNLSSNGNSYKWYFGDGTTSTDINPSHTYIVNGSFNVSLVAYGGTCGSDSITKTSFITAGITVSGDTICANAHATLNAIGNGILKWYSTPAGSVVLNTGNTFITPLLSSTTSYYVEDSVIQGQTYYGARTDKTTTGANNVTAEQGLIFNALQPFVLKSVKVYSTATGTANRTISLKTSSGTVISSVVVSVPAGESRLTLNLNIPAGTNLKLVAAASSNFWRDQSTSDNIYPLTLANIMSITTSTAGTTPLRYYYYFYDWEVKLNCVSPRVEVTALVNPIPEAAGTISGTINACPGQTDIPYSVPAIPNATGYIWTLPSGVTGTSTTNSIRVDFSDSASTGNITVQGTNDCGNGPASVISVNIGNINPVHITESVCDSYVAPDGAVYTSSGIKTAVIPGITGCDSTIIIDLTVKHSSVSSITETACNTYTAPDGIIYTTSGIKTAVIPNISGCDSTITIDLTIAQSTGSSITESVCNTYTAPDGAVYTSSGIETAVISNIAGCDSTITINLTVNQITVSSITASACNSYTAPDGAVYNTGGIRSAVIPNASGCDSIITIDLTVNTVDVSLTVNDPVIYVNDSGATIQWLNCDNAYSIIPNDTSQIYTAPVNGTYAALITQGICSDTSACIVIINAGIASNERNGISVYPNPVSDELTIEIKGHNGISSYKIINSLGQTIIQGYLSDKAVIPTHLFAPGVYFIKLDAGNSLIFEKIIKE